MPPPRSRPALVAAKVAGKPIVVSTGGAIPTIRATIHDMDALAVVSVIQSIRRGLELKAMGLR
jgi:hypothetical protein